MSLSHTDDGGKARMVDVGAKPVTMRTATATATVKLNPEAFSALAENRNKKGDVLAVARIAGIMAAKQTSNLIPLCHQIPLDRIDIQFELSAEAGSVEIVSTVGCNHRTGVEMEALTACSIAALTVYDMLKAVQKDIVISDLKLLSKQGGQSGDFQR